MCGGLQFLMVFNYIVATDDKYVHPDEPKTVEEPVMLMNDDI